MSDIITSVQTSFFKIIENLCNRLHLSTTDIFNEQCYFPPISSVLEMHYTKRKWKEKRKKKGVTNVLKRRWGWLTGNDDLGYEEIVHEETIINVQASKDSICNYLKSAYRLYSSAISKWGNNVNKAIERLEIEVKKLTIEYTNRVEKALEKRVYLDIANKLQSIADKISVIHVQSTPFSTKDANKEQLVKKKYQNYHTIYPNSPMLLAIRCIE